MRENHDSITNINQEVFWDICQDSFDNSEKENEFFTSVRRDLQSYIGFVEGKLDPPNAQNNVDRFTARVKEIIEDYGSDFNGDEAEEILKEYLRKYRYKSFRNRSFESKDYGRLKIISYQPTASGILTIRGERDNFLDFSDKMFEEQFVKWL